MFAVCEPIVRTGVEGGTGEIWRYLPAVFCRVFRQRQDTYEE
jgi:hypothetical protein